MRLLEKVRYLVLSLLIAAAAVLSGCGGPSSKCLLSGENTVKEYLGGMAHLEEKKSGIAAGIFKGILACDDHYSPAYSGLAIANAQIAAAGYNIDNEAVMASRVALYNAKKYSSGMEDDFRRSIAAMRAYTTFKSPGWFLKVENEFRRAMKTKVERAKLPYYEGSDAASYYIGNAYFDAGRLESAMSEYESLRDADKGGKWGTLADRAYKRSGLILSHIERAEGSPRVVVLAFHHNIKREDVAAILIGELKLDRLLSSYEVQMGMERIPVPVDIYDSPFRREIGKILGLRIKGLTSSYSRPSSSYLFRPDTIVSRKDFATIMDDILERLSAGPSNFSLMRRKERGFVDVPSAAPWYKAVMNITNHNIMVPLHGRKFRPYEAIDGPDAFSAVMGLKAGLRPR
ncbi:MAG: S-layer homology domain-containing protein [Thermodesulfobacteriota bacterium]